MPPSILTWHRVFLPVGSERIDSPLPALPVFVDEPLGILGSSDREASGVVFAASQLLELFTVFDDPTVIVGLMAHREGAEQVGGQQPLVASLFGAGGLRLS